MYEIQELTRSERVTISNTFYPVNIDLEHAWYMLEEAKDLFGPAPHALRDYEAERLWHTISLAETIIYNTLTYFYLTTGDKSWPGVESFLRSAKVVQSQQFSDAMEEAKA